METYYVGLAASYHDPALAIVNSKGEIVFAEATERYLQYKRAMSCMPDNRPTVLRLIKEYCDPKAKYVLAKSWSDGLQFRLNNLYLMGLMNQKKLVRRSEKMTKYLVRMYEVFWGASVMFHSVKQIGTHFIGVLRKDLDNNQIKVVNFPHHLTHAATAAYTSPFDEAACMIVDGLGESGAMTYYHYQQGKLKLIKQLKGPESLGILYSTVTKYCGFDPEKGEEWKIMGLAPYGELIEEVYIAFKELLQVKGIAVKYASKKAMDHLLRILEKHQQPPGGPPRAAANLAFTMQHVYGETMTEVLSSFHGMGLSDNLVLGGGCGLNSAYNGQIIERTGFKNVFVPSAPADDGNAIGAALLAYYQDHPNEIRKPGFQTPFLGSSMSGATMERLKKFGKIGKMRHLPGEVHKVAADILAQGKLLGWVQGRAEFGPRALGNRSILADPRPLDMKDKINAMVKFREEFRPFAPAILHEHGEEYFECYQEAPYMDRTLRFREEVRDKVPAVVHANTTGRLQTVKREWNEPYYDLIKAFYEITGVPIVLNTSFNIMGKPIIHSVEDALSVFYTTGLEALVIGDILIEK